MKSFKFYWGEPTNKPKPNEQVPYVRPEWIKSLLKNLGLLLEQPTQISIGDSWASLPTGLLLFVLLIYLGYEFFTGEPLDSFLVTCSIILAIPFVILSIFDETKTDNKLIVLMCSLSKVTLWIFGTLISIALVIIAYFWIRSSWDTTSDIEKLKGLGSVIIGLLVILIFVVYQHNHN